MESEEDETFDGLVLPSGPVNFGERLKHRRKSRSPQRPAPEDSLQPARESRLPQKSEADKEDFLAGLEIGDGEIFSSGRLALHRNVKIKDPRPTSPSRPRRPSPSPSTNKPVSRLPRPSMEGHERTHTASSLEPVSESGGPIFNLARRSQSRLGHSAQSSVSSIPTPTTPSSAQSLPPSTPRRREVGPKTSAISLRNEPTTTSAQLLRLKRSLPAMRQPQSPARPLTTRPPSRTDSSNSHRPQTAMRPKTPVERNRAVFESAAAQARKNPVPFLPAGGSQSQSHHVSAKSSRTFRRTTRTPSPSSAPAPGPSPGRRRARQVRPSEIDTPRGWRRKKACGSS